MCDEKQCCGCGQPEEQKEEEKCTPEQKEECQPDSPCSPCEDK